MCCVPASFKRSTRGLCQRAACGCGCALVGCAPAPGQAPCKTSFADNALPYPLCTRARALRRRASLAGGSRHESGTENLSGWSSGEDRGLQLPQAGAGASQRLAPTDPKGEPGRLHKRQGRPHNPPQQQQREQQVNQPLPVRRPHLRLMRGGAVVGAATQEISGQGRCAWAQRVWLYV